MVNITLAQAGPLWRKRINAIKHNALKGAKEVAEYLVVNAKLMASRETGETFRGIRKRKMKNGWVAESWVSGMFKQNMFANRTKPFTNFQYKYYGGAIIPPSRSRTGEYTKLFQVAPPGMPIIYGQSPHWWNWTGTPGFFNIASRMAANKNSTIMRKHTQKALRVGIT